MFINHVFLVFLEAFIMRTFYLNWSFQFSCDINVWFCIQHQLMMATFLTECLANDGWVDMNCMELMHIRLLFLLYGVHFHRYSILFRE